MPEFTNREMAILELLIRGDTNDEIAFKLVISIPTVKFHITNIMVKLEADNRTRAAYKALKMGIFKLDDLL